MSGFRALDYRPTWEQIMITDLLKKATLQDLYYFTFVSVSLASLITHSQESEEGLCSCRSYTFWSQLLQIIGMSFKIILA